MILKVLKQLADLKKKKNTKTTYIVEKSFI